MIDLKPLRGGDELWYLENDPAAKISTDQAVDLLVGFEDLFESTPFDIVDYDDESGITTYEHAGYFILDPVMKPEYEGFTFVVYRRISGTTDSKADKGYGYSLKIVSPTVELENGYSKQPFDVYQITADASSLTTEVASFDPIYDENNQPVKSRDEEVFRERLGAFLEANSHSGDPIESEEFHKRLFQVAFDIAWEVASETFELEKAMGVQQKPQEAEITVGSYYNIRSVLLTLQVWGIPIEDPSEPVI